MSHEWERHQRPLAPVDTRCGAMAELFPYAVGSRPICPVCLGPMEEVPGFDDYCPPCRQREEWAIEREALAAAAPRLATWFGEWSDNGGPCHASPTT